MGQVRRLEAEHKELRAKTAAHLRAGNRGGGPGPAPADRAQCGEPQAARQAEATQEPRRARDVAVQTARLRRAWRRSTTCAEQATRDPRWLRHGAQIGARATPDRLHEMVERSAQAAGPRTPGDPSTWGVREGGRENALADQASRTLVAREGISPEWRGQRRPGGAARWAAGEPKRQPMGEELR
jgi:hypothetical protein